MAAMGPETNFDQTLTMLKPIYASMGINLFSKHTSNLKSLKYNFVYIFNLIWLNLDLTAALAWFIVGVREGKSVIELTYFAPCYTFSWLSIVKSLCLLFNKDQICDLLDEIRDMEKKKAKQQTEERTKIAKGEVKFLHAELMFFNITYGFLVICFMLSALILIGVKYMKSQVLEPILPFMTVYPFDFTFWRWLFVYLHQIWSGFVVILFMGCADYLYFTCCTYLSIHFKLLQDDFQNIFPKETHRGIFKRDEEFYAELVRLIEYHQVLIGSVNRLEHIYGKSTLFNFVTSSIVICMSGFNVTTISDLPVVLTFTLFLMMSLFQVFFLCFYGDVIMKASIGISDAIFKSHWYTADYKLGKVLNIIQMRAQKPCKLTAYSFADVNLGAFTRILSRSWSYFALLKTIYK